MLPSASVEETVQIINGLKPRRYEAHHDVRYTAAVRAACTVELAVKYINDAICG